MRHGLAEARNDATQDNANKVVVSHLGIYVESMDIIQKSLDNICLLEIPDLVKSSLWLIVVIILFSNTCSYCFPTI